MNLKAELTKLLEKLTGEKLTQGLTLRQLIEELNALLEAKEG